MFPLSPDEAWKLSRIDGCFDEIEAFEKSACSPEDEVKLARIDRIRTAMKASVRSARRDVA